MEWEDERALQGKAIVVTGAGQGIGAATARLSAALGARVLVNDIDPELAETVAGEIVAAGGDAASFGCDVGRWEAGEEVVAACLDRFGGLDGLVNNAGVYRMNRIEELSEEDFTAILKVNVVGVAACTQAAVRHMRAQGRGAIVNLVSGAQAGMPALTAYGASKGAVASMTYTWAVELAGSGVRVNGVSPRAETRMAAMTRSYGGAAARVIGESFPTAAANASPICYLLSDSSAAIHGQIVRIDGNSLALMTHPAILEPVLTSEEWTFTAVRRAFEEIFQDRQQPLGVARVECRPLV